MTSTRRLLLKSAALATLSASAPWVRAQPADKVRLSWLPIMQATPLYVAVEDRLFEKAGLDVELVKFQNPNQIIDSLIANQADAGAPGAAAGITMLGESRYPGTFKVFGLQGGTITGKRLNDALIVKNGSSIKSFKDLQGKTLGHLPGVQWRTISRAMLRANGLNPDKDVRLQEIAVGLQLPAVVAGSVDATLSLEPVASIALATGAASVALSNPCAGTIADPFYSGVSVLTTRFIRERPKVAMRLVRVLDQATRIANTDFNRVRPYLGKYTGMRPEDSRVVAQPYLRGWEELGTGDIASYQALVNVFHQEGVLANAPDVKAVMLQRADLV